MKKTLNINIGGTLFHVEEDAYEALNSYLNSIRDHFHANEDKDEIMRDIEDRIAEKFSERKGIISKVEVESVIETMGTVEQFDENDEEKTSDTEDEKHKHHVTKRLYRDKENVMVAGVSGGLGYYFGIDPLIFRILFFASIFLGGAGIIAYIILWIFVPEARTSSQRLDMKGSPVTISNVADMIKEKIEEVQSPRHKSFLGKIFAIPMQILTSIVEMVQNLVFPAVRVIVGVGIALLSFISAIGATILLGMSLFAATPTFIEGPLLILAGETMTQILLISLYLIVLIPCIFAALLGINLMSKKNVIGKGAAISLLSVWFIAIIFASLTGSRTVMQATEIMKNDPYYKTEVRQITVPTFSKLSIENNQSVTLVEGKELKVIIRGRAKNIDPVIFEVTDGVLTIKEKEIMDNSCLFCNSGRADIEITVPTLSAITLIDSSRVEGKLTGTAVTIDAINSSSVNLSLTVTNVTITGDDSSNISLRGTATAFTGDIKNASHLNAYDLELKDATIKVSNLSSGDLSVEKKLNMTATNGSTIHYKGSPIVQENVDESSSVHNDHEVID